MSGRTALPKRLRFQAGGLVQTLYRRSDAADAPFYIHVSRGGHRYQKSLETCDPAEAVQRAQTFIAEAAVAADQERVAAKYRAIQQRNGGEPPALVRPVGLWVNGPLAPEGVSTLAKVIEIYKRVACLPARTIQNNSLAILKIFERLHGKTPDPALISLQEVDGSLPARFQEAMLAVYAAGAIDMADQREARERALRTSRSIISQARSIFSARGFDLMARYEAEGLNIPETVREFLTAKLRGSRFKADYRVPPPETIDRAFALIEHKRESDPEVYLAWWFCLGAGLRRKELAACRWENIIDRGDQLWVWGGVGKDGLPIKVPIQSRAADAIRPFRKTEGPVMESSQALRDQGWARRLNAWMTGLGWQTEKKMHELRAIVGSRIYAQSPTAAKDFLRHKSVTTTEKFYVRYGGQTQQTIDVI